MKRNRWLLATACAIVIAASMPAIAADKMKPKSDAAQSATQSGKAADMPNRQPLSDASMSAEELIGKPVMTTDDHEIGEVEAVVASHSGQVRAVVVGIGGFLGVGEHQVAIESGRLYVSDQTDALHTDMTETALKALPEYTGADERRQKSASSGTQGGDTRTYGRSARETTMEKAADPKATTTPTAPKAAGNEPTLGQQTSNLTETVAADTLLDAEGNLKASRMIGMAVVNNAQKVVGEIRDVMFQDSGDPKVAIGSGGVLGIGQRVAVVDWNDIDVYREGDRIQVRSNISEAEMKALQEQQAPNQPTAMEQTKAPQATTPQATTPTSPPPRTTSQDGQKNAAEQKVNLPESVAAKTVLDRQGNLKGSELIGMGVVGHAQQTVGEIKDILFRENTKPKVAIGSGGLLGIGERVVLLNWDEVNVHREKDRVQIRTELSEADLKKLPEQQARK